MSNLRRGTRLGKYKIIRRLNNSRFSTVYKAHDTVEDARVALKVPIKDPEDTFEDLIKEVRLTLRLDHPNILRPRNADYINGNLVIAYDLGVESLGERLQRRISTEKAMDIIRALLSAMAAAHAKNILHLDVKPENVILFPHGEVRLCDFGISRVARRTELNASGSGTLGFMSPEQAYGRPSRASDVFSVGLIFYRMLTGVQPKWPFKWPFAGYETLRRKVTPAVINVIKKATRFEPRSRYRDCGQMADALERALKTRKLKRKRKARKKVKAKWKDVRAREFKRAHGKSMKLAYHCYRCDGPVAEAMDCCPWCGAPGLSFEEVTTHSKVCPDCRKGVLPNWSYCPWCYGPGFQEVSSRDYRYQYSDAHCANPSCCGSLPAYARYCPWCRRKVKKPWRTNRLKNKCPGCGWEVSREDWDSCPWCAKKL